LSQRDERSESLAFKSSVRTFLTTPTCDRRESTVDADDNCE
jgi:hypothetical protein